MLPSDDGMRLEFVRDYDEPLEAVWAALTEQDRVAGWLGRWSGDPGSGTVHLVMSEEGAEPEPMTILGCEPPRRLDVGMASPDGTWHLSVGLERRGPGTRLVFVHRLAEPYDASSIGPGWHYYLDRFGAVVTGTPVPDDFDVYFPALQSAYGRPS
jgi:uncharacterized protein YndB with AHSA1/START domain